VLIAYESINYLKWKKGKIGDCVVKLDVTKVYDRVEWSYLQIVMSQLGFNDNWVNPIM
jgi:hypothetical protein